MNKVIVLLLVVAFPVNAGIYKWTDSNGNVHFGDKPVDFESATELNISSDNKTGVTNSSGNKADRKHLLEEIENEKQEQAKKNKKRLASNKKRQKRCNNYKRHYQNQLQTSRLYKMSPDGERTYLSESQLAARMKKINEGIAKNCR